MTDKLRQALNGNVQTQHIQHWSESKREEKSNDHRGRASVFANRHTHLQHDTPKRQLCSCPPSPLAAAVAAAIVIDTAEVCYSNKLIGFGCSARRVNDCADTTSFGDNSYERPITDSLAACTVPRCLCEVVSIG